MVRFTNPSRFVLLPALVVCLILCDCVKADTVSSTDAVARAKQYVLSRLDADTGRCLDEYDPSDPRYGGMTALCAYALLSSGCDYHKTPALRKAIRRLMQTKLTGTEAVALRAMVLAMLKDSRARKRLGEDVRWLIEAAYQDGSYTSVSANGRTPSPGDPFDNTSSQWAVLGVSAGVEQGLNVPNEYWRRIETHWRNQQQPDGGWGYCARPREGKLHDRPYGSMTAAGVDVLSLCRDRLSRENVIRGLPTPPDTSLTKGLAWLEKHFSVDVHPRKNAEMYHVWLFSLQRVGAATGRKYIAGVDWHATAAERLRKQQNPDGSWGYGPRTDQTCFALLFLARGEAPILLSKLQYPGPWNTRPRDAANLTGWLTYMFERPMGWQVLDMTAKSAGGSEADWEDGRIAYLSGLGPIELTDEQINLLRRFVQRGGLIFCEAVGDNGEFTASVQRLAVRLFPQYPLSKIPPTHPIYNAQFSEAAPRDLQMADNGIRPLLILSPHDVSLALQLGPDKRQRETFNLLANLYLYLTEKGASSPRGLARRPEPSPEKPTRTIFLARVYHTGNCDPEPAAMDRLAADLARRGVALQTSNPLPWDKIEAEQYPVAQMTGTNDFTLSDRQRINLKAYLSAGGTLLADAAGGSRAFADAFRREVLAPLGKTQPLADGVIPMNRFVYRKAASGRDERELFAPRLEAIYRNGRPVVIFSPDDITAGLVGYPLLNLKGLSPETARTLMADLVLQLSPPAKIKPTAK